jgi:hypothetical protein
MAYTLTTEIYSTNTYTTSQFKEYKDAVEAAKHLADVLNATMKLTRHSSINGSVGHLGYYADSYNELSIVVKATK